MPAQPPRPEGQWIIWAIPTGVVVLLLSTALLIVALRPESKPADTEIASAPPAPVVQEPKPIAPEPPAPVARVETPTPPAPAPSPTPPPTPAPIASLIPKPEPAIPAPPVVAAPTTPAPPVPPVTKPANASRNLLAALKLPEDAVTGTWQMEGGVLKCTDGNAKNRARVRLVPPPADREYDFSVTFTTEGKKPYVAQILTFKGRQFIWTYMWDDSGFANVGGRPVHDKNGKPTNSTTVAKGIKSGVKYTSVVKVRNNLVAAYLNDELYSSYTTDYSDLSLSNIWSLADDKPLGVAVECPVTIEAISLTVVDSSGSPVASPVVVEPPAAPTLTGVYRQLAALISSPFSIQSAAAATQPSARAQWGPSDLQRIIATTQPVISDVAAELLAARTAGATQPSIQPSADTEALFLAVLFTTGRDASDDTSPVDPLLERSNPGNNASEGPPGDAARAEFDAEQARLAAWRKLESTIATVYAKAKPKPGLVKLQVTPGAFVATNTSSSPLANVTLAIDVVHALTTPSPTSSEYYFIASWPPNQKIYFRSVIVPNVLSSQLTEGIAPIRRLGAGGILEARTRVWSDQLTQPSESTKFDVKVESIASTLLNEAYGDVDEAVRRIAAPPPASRIARRVAIVPGPVMLAKAALADNTPGLLQAKAAAKRVLALVPPESPLAAQANALLADPQTALRDLRKKQIDEFLAALTAQKSRAGVWITRRPGGIAKLSTAAGRQSALGSGPDKAGRVTLTIDQRGATGEVSATLTNPDQPTVKRKLGGRLHVDASANRLLLQLRAQANSTRPPTEADIKVVTNWTRLLLELHDTDLRGLAEIGPGSTGIILQIGFDPPQDVKK